MTWIVHTGCRYHNQDTSYYCGAAAAMMILKEIGVPYSELDQDDLYTSNHDHNAVTSGWYTDPHGLEWTLDHRRPLDTAGYVTYKHTFSEAEGTRKIVDTLHKYEVSPAALIYGCMHWIVVPGVQTDVEPVEGANYTVQGFWIHNPTWHAGEPPPPHNATDACGSGGTLGDANDWVSYAGWQNMFTGCNYDDPQNRLQYISVCDPEEPKIKLPMRPKIEFLVDGRRLLDRGQAIKFSETGLEKYALLEDKRVEAAVKGTQPGKPQAVLRLDQRNTYYYLVPWESKEGVTALTQVDARFGTFLSLHLREKPIRKEFLSRDDVLERVAYKQFRLPKRWRRLKLNPEAASLALIAYRRLELLEDRGRLKLYPEAASLAPTLVWQPCQESYSPHLPFYQFNVGLDTIYVRVDGEVFTQLTTTGLKGD